MQTKIIEASTKTTEPTDWRNWGKFLVGKMADAEWTRPSEVSGMAGTSLLRACGWTPGHLWVLDLQTGEGAFFRIGGFAPADLNKHAIWVCPLFEPFLAWLYKALGAPQLDIQALPDHVELDAEFSLHGYRRPGKIDKCVTDITVDIEEAIGRPLTDAERAIAGAAVRRAMEIG